MVLPGILWAQKRSAIYKRCVPGTFEGKRNKKELQYTRDVYQVHVPSKVKGRTDLSFYFHFASLSFIARLLVSVQLLLPIFPLTFFSAVIKLGDIKYLLGTRYYSSCSKHSNHHQCLRTHAAAAASSAVFSCHCETAVTSCAQQKDSLSDHK